MLTGSDAIPGERTKRKLVQASSAVEKIRAVIIKYKSCLGATEFLLSPDKGERDHPEKRIQGHLHLIYFSGRS